MPGSPPISTKLPATNPPPSILSTSPLPKHIRGSCSMLMLSTSSGLALPCGKNESSLLLLSLVTSSSTKVFHSLQAGHFPNHLGASYPQF
jgi:hypothetical protein